MDRMPCATFVCVHDTAVRRRVSKLYTHQTVRMTLQSASPTSPDAVPPSSQPTCNFKATLNANMCQQIMHSRHTCGSNNCPATRENPAHQAVAPGARCPQLPATAGTVRYTVVNNSFCIRQFSQYTATWRLYRLGIEVLHLLHTAGGPANLKPRFCNQSARDHCGNCTVSNSSVSKGMHTL